MNNISKTTFLKYLRCQRAAAFEMQIAPLVANYKKQLKTITKAEEKEFLELETKQKVYELALSFLESDDTNLEEDDFDHFFLEDEALQMMMATYFQIEELAAEKVQNLFQGVTFFGKREDEQVYEQKIIHRFEQGFNFYTFVDIFNEDQENVRLIEVKATTSRKYLDLGPLIHKVKESIFYEDEHGILRLKEQLDDFEVFDKYYTNRAKLFDYLSDVGRYVYDLAWQRYLLEKNTNKKKKYSYYLAVLNTNYVYDGKVNERGENIYNANDIITLIDLTTITKEMQLLIESHVNLVISRINEPNLERISLDPKKCLFNKGYQECPFSVICKKDFQIPEKDSLYIYFDNFRGFGEKGNKIYVEELFENGVTHALDINTNLLNQKQLMQYFALKNNKPYVEKKVIKAMLNDLEYPLFHLDFETLNHPLPQFKGESPYQQSVFQFSLHIENKEGEVDFNKNHIEFLSKNQGDDRFLLVEALVKAIPSHKKGTVIVYNQAFEKSRLKELAKAFPKYKKELMSIYDRVFDLMYFLKPNEELRQMYINSRKGLSPLNYYHKDLQRSYSIKKVLPIFAPTLSYELLDGVQNGKEAQVAFMRLKYLKGEQFRQTYDNLLKYCQLDTWAMAEILKGLRELTNE